MLLVLLATTEKVAAAEIFSLAKTLAAILISIAKELRLSAATSASQFSKGDFPASVCIKLGEQFEEAYLLVSGEVQIKQGEKVYRLGAGSVLGLSEGMVGLASRYTATALSAIQVKIIPFHKVDAIMNVLPPELKAILVTIIKRNLAA